MKERPSQQARRIPERGAARSVPRNDDDGKNRAEDG
jgi:hypothetical protein